VPDVALVLETIAGPDDFDSTSAQQPVEPYSELPVLPATPLRIGYFKEALESPALDKEISSSIMGFADQLRAAGHTVEAVDFEYLDYIVPTYYVLTTAESSSNLSRYDGVKFGQRDKSHHTSLTDFYSASRSAGFGWEVKKRIMLGTFVLSAGYYDAYFTKAQQVRKLLTDRINTIFSQYDAVLLPTAPSTAFKIGEKTDDPIAMYLADIFTVFSNLTGIPTISLPLFWHSNGMPYGLQIMTNHFSELYLLRLSNEWMQQFRRAG
jgi:aspartyl-tRNA(Asn)/glutamyl-tRNA(Gln) amidotransferase subunit A